MDIIHKYDNKFIKYHYIKETYLNNYNINDKYFYNIPFPLYFMIKNINNLFSHLYVLILAVQIFY